MSGTRRVAYVVHSIVPADPRVRRQSDALREGGYEVDIIALRDPGQPKRESLDGVRILRLPVRRSWYGMVGHLAEYLAFMALATVALTGEHRRRRFNLVQVATVPDFLAVAALPVKLSGVPLLLDLHEDLPAFYADRFPGALARPLGGLVTAVTKGSAALADELITVHEPLRQLSIGRGVPPDRISVVMNSADGKLFDPARYDRRPFMADGQLRLIHHSNFQRIYGLDVAIAGLARLRPGLDWRLDVYGDGPWRRQIEDAIARTGTGGRATLHGKVPLDNLPGLLAAADVGLVPSLPERYLEYSLSTKLLEYAAMGVPTIASDLETFRHHFSDTALRFVPGGDPDALARAIEALVDDPAGTVALGREAQRQAAAYDWEAQKARYLGVVGRLTADKISRVRC